MTDVCRRAAAVGTFDGVHRGHLAVLDTLKSVAQARGCKPVVFTFDRHPLEVIAPERAPKRIMLPSREREVLEQQGVEVVTVQFTPELCHLTARQWMESLRDDYGVEALVMGYDNTFGSDGRRMKHSDYAELGRSLGLDVTEAPVVPGVSSSAVRKAIAAGDVETAADMLGNSFDLHGTVVHGDALGRELGFPTANLKVEENQIVPADGVYAATATTQDGDVFKAVVNVGKRPTIGKDEQRVEAYIADFHGDLYGKPLCLGFKKRLRDEKRFASLDELKQQIGRDVAEALKA